MRDLTLDQSTGCAATRRLFRFRNVVFWVFWAAVGTEGDGPGGKDSEGCCWGSARLDRSDGLELPRPSLLTALAADEGSGLDLVAGLGLDLVGLGTGAGGV